MDKKIEKQEPLRDGLVDRRKVLTSAAATILAGFAMPNRAEAQEPIDVGAFFYRETGSTKDRKFLLEELLPKITEHNDRQENLNDGRKITKKVFDLGNFNANTELTTYQNGAHSLTIFALPRAANRPIFAFIDLGLTGNIYAAQTYQQITADGRRIEFRVYGGNDDRGLDDALKLYRGILEKILASF